MSDVPSRFLSTAILLYSISMDKAEGVKRARALELLNEDNGALSIHVLEEFYREATRPSRSDPLSHDLAAGLIRCWMRFKVQDVTRTILEAAFDIKATYGFSYRNSAMIAAARALGCQVLYSEDIGHGRTLEGLTVVNPFR